MKTTLMLIASILLLTTNCFSQSTSATNIGTLSKFIGYTNNFQLDVYTNNILRGRFSINNSLSTPWDYSGPFDPTGDGLQLLPVGGGASLDLFAGINGTTHINFGGSGSISGQNSRFEQFANGSGFYFRTVSGGVYKFSRGTTVTGIIGSNNFWRIGEQTDAMFVNGDRRLHVVDRDYQFRLTFAGTSSNTGPYTDFLSNLNGNLQIEPSGKRVGINTNFDPQSTMDVNGDLRIRYVKDTVPNSILVGVSGAGPSDLKVRRLDFTGSSTDVLLGNGTFGPLMVGGALGAWCGSSPSTGALSFSTRINTNNYNFYIANTSPTNNSTYNKVGIGYDCTTLSAKLNVLQNENSALNFNTTGTFVDNQDIGSQSGLNYIGVHGITRGVQTANFVENTGGLFIGMNSHWNVGVRGIATCGTYNNPTSDTTTASIGGDFSAYSGLISLNGYSAYGVRSEAHAAKNNYGVSTNAFGGSIAIGIYATASGGSTTRAGYFAGDVDVTGLLTTSDQQFKQNVNEISSALEIVTQLRPVSYQFDVDEYPQFHFGTEQQYGFIAQEVETVLPNLVHNSKMPAQYDSLGNETSPVVDYKSLNYIGLIPINTQAIIELNQKLESKDSIIDSLQNQVGDLNNRLTNLENCLSAILPSLCQMNQSLIENNTPEQQEQVRKNLAVTLNNRTAIVLDQNVPNPFAEQTIVHFSIPATVLKAQIHFYDGNGKLIQSVDVAERGLGSLTVFGSDLSSGTYTYTLVADGQIVATKKMMKE